MSRESDAGPRHDHGWDRHLIEQEDVVEGGGDGQRQERGEQARSQPARGTDQPGGRRHDKGKNEESDEDAVLS